MTQLKIANWNIEWMNRWFNADSEAIVAFKSPEIEELAQRVANVITDMKADLITIQEGPSRLEEMTLFVQTCLNDQYRVWGPVGKGQQKPYILEKKDSDAIAKISPIDAEYDLDFKESWPVDINGDLTLKPYKFTRPPVVLGVETENGRFLRLLNLHTKSKYVHNGQQLWQNPETRPDFIKQAILARRRISAEALRVRQYLNLVFKQASEAAIIVAGDFNDGPNLDTFETQYLTHNVAGLIAGSPYNPQTMLRHAFIDLMDKEKNYTAEFFNYVTEQDEKLLLDHIFVSANLFWTGETRTAFGQIEHDIFEKYISSSLQGRAKFPSDHRPQTVTIEL